MDSPISNNLDESKSKTALYLWAGGVIFGLLFTLLIWL